MSKEKIKLELEKATVEDFFQVAGLNMPEFTSEKEFKSALAIIKSQLNPPVDSTSASGEPVYKTANAPTNLQEPAPKFVSTQKTIQEATEQNQASIIRPRSVLVVDDLGIIIYQLNLLLKRLNYDVVISQDTSDAIEKFKAKDFGYAILDLYIPTEREGFYLIDEIKKLSLLCKLNTKIIVMSATSREAFKVKAIQHGANLFIEKAQGWQKKVVDACVE